MKKDKIKISGADTVRILFSSVFVVICIAPCTAMLFSGTENTLKEETPPPPCIISDGKLNGRFGEDFEKWFSCILPFRSSNISAASRIKSKVFSTGSQKVIQGRNGWLFYEEEVRRYCGAEKMSDREIYAAARYLYLLSEYCEENGIDFLFAAAPDKASVCSEMLPGSCTEQGDGFELERLHSCLSEMRVGYCDISSVFEKNGCGYYLRTDTHWNNLGALLAWNAVIDCTESPHKSYYGADYSLSGEITGDLAEMLFPADTPTEKQYRINCDLNDDYRFLRPNSAGGLTDRESIMENVTDSSERYDFIIQTECPSAYGGKAVIRRDSFGRAMLPYFIDNYKSAYFTRSMTVSFSELAGADDFIYEIAERNLNFITSEICYIPSPAREIPSYAVLWNGNDSVYTDQSYDMPLIYGEIDTRRFDGNENADIIIVLSNEDAEYAFEAFPSGGYGFGAYIDTTVLTQGKYDIYTAVVNNGDGSRSGILGNITV